MRKYGVRLKPETGQSASWGPFDTNELAHTFAAVITAAVDPAEVFTLMDPLDEVIRAFHAEAKFARSAAQDRSGHTDRMPAASIIWRDEYAPWSIASAEAPDMTCRVVTRAECAGGTIHIWTALVPDRPADTPPAGSAGPPAGLTSDSLSPGTSPA